MERVWFTCLWLTLLAVAAYIIAAAVELLL